jgi:Protein of unknown function (DUF1275)
MKIALPALLSFNAGYVDTAAYLALQGLFTAHVTGNFVTIASALAFGTSGVVTKLSALPVFCAVVMLTRIVSYGLPARNNGADPNRPCGSSSTKSRQARPLHETLLAIQPIRRPATGVGQQGE